MTPRRLTQMDRADLIDYIRDLEGQIQGYEDAEAERMLEQGYEDLSDDEWLRNEELPFEWTAYDE